MTRPARVAAIAFLILSTAAVGGARPTCDHVCVSDEHYEGMLARYKYVLVGRVEDRTDTPEGPEFYVKAIRVWKGDTREITLRSIGGTCGKFMVMGQAYVVFAAEKPAEIDICSPVIATSDKRALKAISRLDRARGLPPLALQKEDLPPTGTIQSPLYSSVPTERGGAVHADQYGKGPRAVVLASGERFDRWSWQRQANTLANAGFRVLAIDFLNPWPLQGRPQPTSDDTEIHVDVLSAVRYLRKTGAQTVSIVGAGFGGAAAARAAMEAQPGEIDRLVLLAPGPFPDPARLQVPKLFISTRDDANEDGSPRLAAIRDQYEKAPEPKQLVVLKGSAHGQFVFTTDQGHRAMEEIVRFLSQP
jgi:dienelactone hydrolase